MEPNETNELLSRAKEVIAEPDVIVDTYDLSFAWINPKLAETLGYDESEMKGKQTMAMHADDPEQARKTETEIFTASEEIIKEMPVKTKDGKELTVKFRIRHFDFNNVPYMVGKLIG